MYQYFGSKQMVNTTASTVELWMMMITLFMCHGKIAVNNQVRTPKMSIKYIKPECNMNLKGLSKM